jgi:hypothetical protein
MLALKDEGLASLEADREHVVPLLGDKIILVRELGVSGILLEGVGQTIANSHTLDFELRRILHIQQMVGNGWHVVAGVALTCDIEVSTNKLWVLLQESS